MKCVIDKTNGLAYLQLYHQLRDDIINEAFGYNSKLPSKRVLSEKAGVSAITVEHAYTLLCDEGYAEFRERSGYYVIFHADDGFAAPTNSLGTQPSVSYSSTSHSDFPFSLL